MSVTIEKDKYATRMPGQGNAEFYGWCNIDGKRRGTVWRFNDGHYQFNEDFDTVRHSRANRPAVFSAERLAALKQRIAIWASEEVYYEQR